MILRIYNKTLDPKLWDENKQLKPEIRESLLKIAMDFYETTDFTSEMQDILMLGSSTNYNWTNESDIDLHILVDIATEKINNEYARKFMDGIGAKWNDEHDIVIKGHNVEVYIQDINETNRSLASYSIMHNEWVKPPVPQEINLDKEKIKHKYHEIKKKIDDVIETGDVDKLKSLMKSIRSYREAGLSKEGEYSTENVVFKALRHTDMLAKLKDATQTIYDKQVSITEGFGETFIVTGMVAPDLEVVGDRYYAGEPLVSHGGLRYLHGNWNESLDWRYRSDINTIFYKGDVFPTEDQKEAVEGWLNKKYQVRNPRWERVTDLNRKLAHRPEANQPKYPRYIEEGIEMPQIVIGNIDGDLEINGVQSNTTNALNHKGSGKRWRFRTDGNTVFWGDEPTDMEKDTVDDFLYRKYAAQGLNHTDLRKQASNIKMALHTILRRLPDDLKKNHGRIRKKLIRKFVKIH